MKTYLKVTFSSEGSRPSKVNDALSGVGFKATTGPHDWVYDWPDDASVDEVLNFADQIHAELEGMGVLFELETL